MPSATRSRVFRIVAAAVLSLPCAALVFNQDFFDPGAWIVHYCLPQGQRDLGEVLLVHLGSDFMLCFALWYPALGLTKYL